MVNYKVKNKEITLILCIFGGYFGLHHFYNKQYKKGLIYLFTLGLFYIGWFGDIFILCKEIIKSKTREKNNKNFQISNEKKDNFTTTVFDVVGESYDNEDGINRQTRIKQILENYKKNNKDNLYGGLTNKEILDYYEDISEFNDIIFTGNYKEYKYKNEKAYAIYMKDSDGKEYQVGNIARLDIPTFSRIVNNHEIVHFNLYVTGGNIKFVDYDDNEKEYVNTKNLFYGIKIKIIYK